MLKDVQTLLVQALQTPDPAAHVRAQLGDPRWQLCADERAWLAAVDAHAMLPEVGMLLRERHGEAAGFDVYGLDPDKRIPAEILGKPGDWKPLSGEKLAPRDKAAWGRDGAAITGSGSGDAWHLCDLGSRKYRDCAVRARVKTEGVLGGV